jgi:hypothetical protein
MRYKVVRDIAKGEEALEELIEIRKLLEELVALYKKDHFYYTPGLYEKALVTVPPD